MNRPDFDNMTDKEERQNRAWCNWYLGTKLRKRIQEARVKAELGIDEGEKNDTNG